MRRRGAYACSRLILLPAEGPAWGSSGVVLGSGAIVARRADVASRCADVVAELSTMALWFNRRTGSKPEIQCFLGLYIRFY